MKIPTKIQQALTARAESDQLASLSNSTSLDLSPVSVGDIRLIKWQGHDQYRHVLVVNVDSQGSACEVLLLHSEIELATEFDIILDRTETKAPYVLVAQTDVRGIVWTFDLEAAVGRVAKATDRFLLTNSQYPSDSEMRGVTLAGPLDIRWQFKRREGEILAEISESCTVDRLTGAQIYGISSTVLHSLIKLERREFEAARDSIAELVVDKRLLVSPSDDEAGIVQALSISTWSHLDADLAHDFLLVICEQLRENLVGGSDERQWQEVIEITKEDLISV